MEKIPYALHLRIGVLLDGRRAQAKVPRKQAEQVIHALVSCQAALRVVNSKERLLDCPNQLGIVAQGVLESSLKTGRVSEPQPLSHAGDVGLRKVEHPVGEAILFRCMSIVYSTRLDEHCTAGSAGMNGSVAVELLRALVGDAHQQLIVIVRIVGMPLEMGVQALDAGVLIAANSDPVLTCGVVQLERHTVASIRMP